MVIIKLKLALFFVSFFVIILVLGELNEILKKRFKK